MQKIVIIPLFLALVFLFFNCQSDEKTTEQSIETVEKTTVQPPKLRYPTDTIPEDTFSEISELEKIFKQQKNQPAKEQIALDFPLPTHRHVLENNQFMFKLKGRWIGKQAPPTHLKIKFFSNQIADFTNEKPIHEWKVPLSKKASATTFRVSQIMLHRWKGLYYYVIESMDGQECFFVGRTELL